MIDPGIPDDRAGWPGGLLDHLQKFRQGHLVATFPAFYLGNPEAAVHALTATRESSGVVEFERHFRYGMIVTQTCDIREDDRTSPRRPWVSVAPVYDGKERYSVNVGGKERSLVGSNVREYLRAGHGPQYLFMLPENSPEPGFWVADFRLIVPVEKGWLVNHEPIDVFPSDAERRRVGQRLAMLQARPAFDTRFERAVRRPLVQALRDLKDRDPALLSQIYAETDMVAVRADDNVAMQFAEVWVVLAADPPSDRVRQWFDEQFVQWREVASAENLKLLAIQYRSERDMTLREYRQLSEMPFDIR